MRRFFTQTSPVLLVGAGIAAGVISAWWPFGPADSEPLGLSTTPVPQLAAAERSTDCGAAALYAICKLSGVECTLEEIRQRTKTSIVGTSMFNLRQTALSLGFGTNACRCSFEHIRLHCCSDGCFAILYSPARSHFLAAVAGDHIGKLWVIDSDSGVLHLSARELERWYGWDGAALLLAAGKYSAS